MTATTAEVARKPGVTPEQMRAAMHRLWTSIRDGDADEEWALVCMRDHRPDLSPWGRLDIWDRLDTGFSRLECLNTPGGCSCHDYRASEAEDLETAAEADIASAVRDLLRSAA